MKRIAIAAALLLGAVVWADRTDVWNANSVAVQKVELDKLIDGGCAVQAYATLTKQDGGMAYEGTRRVEVAGTNRADCLNILDVRAPVLFKSDKGL